MERTAPLSLGSSFLDQKPQGSLLALDQSILGGGWGMEEPSLGLHEGSRWREVKGLMVGSLEAVCGCEGVNAGEP